MATSSIIENIRINNPQVLVEYLEAIKRWREEPIKEVHTNVVDDPERMDRFMKKFLAKHGETL
ncbi:MAG: hypothetical protein IJS40_08355 [Synergistaceae bacterium]|nr:hypothetical protein [Synergistaceae bacterium]